MKRKQVPKKPKPRKNLTPKQEAFIKWYCSAEVAQNATEAARRAGYKGTDQTIAQAGAQNLRKPQIASQIERRLAEATKGAEVTVESVLRDLTRIRDAAEAAGQHSAAAKCTELHGKYLKMWTERIEHVQTIDDVSTEQLVALLREIAKGGQIDIYQLIAGDGATDGDLSDPARAKKTH